MRVPMLKLLLAVAAIVAATPTFAQAVIEGRVDAPVRVVEYLSYTCPHCAEQEVAVGRQLEALVARGAISREVRHAVRDPIDLGVAIVSRCQGPAATPGNRQALFAAQADWLAKADSVLTARRAELAALPPVDAFMTLLDGAGVLPMLRARGLTDNAARACLGDERERDALIAQSNEAWQVRGIPGTPHTLVNDQPVDGHDWVSLDAAIQAAATRQR